jgi:chromosome segregation ATPase
MSKFLKVAADLFGFSTERVEKMTAEEKTKLEAYGEKASILELDRDTAIQERDAANVKVSGLETALNTEKEAKEAAEAKVSEYEASIAQLQAELAEKDVLIASLPGAAATTVSREQDADLPGNKKDVKVIRSWEKPLQK